MFLKVLAILVIAGGVGPTALAQSCEVAKSVPADHRSLGSGSATVHYKGTTSVRGGQSVYVKIKNENVLGVSYILTIENDIQPPVTICTYNAVLPPRATVLLSGALFADPPVSWKVTVEIGDESDAGVLTYDVYSVPPPAPPPKRKNFRARGREEDSPWGDLGHLGIVLSRQAEGAEKYWHTLSCAARGQFWSC
jgi:hypothetical protein